LILPLKYKPDWEMTKKRFTAWWGRSKIGRPALRIIARLKEPLEPLEDADNPASPLDFHLDVERRIKELRNFCRTHLFLGESFPALDINIGPLSVATYLGAEPVFAWDTVWYHPCATPIGEQLQEQCWGNNYWWKTHLDVIRRARVLAGEDFLVNIPDMGENLDVLAVLRGTQEFIYDLIDNPQEVKKLIQKLNELYFVFYDQIYEAVKGPEGGSSYTTFEIWGPGKTAKVQCDFSALMSPKQFKEFFLPSLGYQCSRLDYTLYHLDGVDAIKHLSALLEVEDLDALQWTPGAGKPDGGSEEWYPIYDRAREAGKSLWIKIEDGNFDDWIKKAENLVKRYGASGLYLLFPEMEMEMARELLKRAEENWDR
jgi:5-methyltetrahydrofolate--homocysteine methyltransferase